MQSDVGKRRLGDGPSCMRRDHRRIPQTRLCHPDDARLLTHPLGYLCQWLGSPFRCARHVEQSPLPAGCQAATARSHAAIAV